MGAEGIEPLTAIPSIKDALWLAPNFVAQVFVFIGTLFFFILIHSDLYSATRLGERRGAVDRTVAKYFAGVSLVNIG